MKNNNQRHGKVMLQQEMVKNISKVILKLQNHWASGMNQAFNYLPAKMKIATWLLAGILLTAWNIARLSSKGSKDHSIPPILAKSGRMPATLASDSLILMEKIYESRKNPQR
ncbi:hypothetical protein CPT03_13540 [Pedobacter ginsengisoli]|uniref:Uncharacterized protein n=1 Tax=Pedobacter ginsengisoli TaxID=363852 RepID=A0A2D1U735_9SPHI|nr:hypothetical protein [Pedobacter ginsengisoli]ATP57421.1 hypothetical protein CPT03_13540 [Pedobacter ginsengisoli]